MDGKKLQAQGILSSEAQKVAERPFSLMTKDMAKMCNACNLYSGHREGRGCLWTLKGVHIRLGIQGANHESSLKVFSKFSQIVEHAVKHVEQKSISGSFRLTT